MESGQKIWPRNLWIPKSVGWCIGAMSEMIALMVRPIKYYNPNFSRFAVDYTCTDLTFTAEKAASRFGYENKYPVEDAVKRTIEYYRERA